MSDFRKLSDSFWASPQIVEDEVAEIGQRGFAMIINNRPDGEAPGQPSGAAIATAAEGAGLEYRAIPVDHTGFGPHQVAAMRAALDEAQGPVLAYCRSGTRSTLLWALACAQAGDNPDTIARAAGEAGYDVAPIRPALDSLSRSTGG